MNMACLKCVWKFKVLQNTLTPGNFLGIPAISAEVREIFDEKQPILMKFHIMFTKIPEFQLRIPKCHEKQQILNLERCISV